MPPGESGYQHDEYARSLRVEKRDEKKVSCFKEQKTLFEMTSSSPTPTCAGNQRPRFRKPGEVESIARLPLEGKRVETVHVESIHVLENLGGATL